MKRYRGIIALLMSVIMLGGCASERNRLVFDTEDPTTVTLVQEEEESTEEAANNADSYVYDYSVSIYDEDREFTDAQREQQEEFEQFLGDIFVEEMSANSITLHFLIENPEDYGIEDLEPAWGEVDYLNIDETKKELQDTYKELKSFDYDSLTDEEQIIWDMLDEYLADEIDQADNYLFASAFAPSSGIQNELPIIFSEYDFREQDDIEDYLVLAETAKDYIDAMCEYEKYRLEQGYSLTAYSIDKVIEQCEEFIGDEENCLISVFSEKLDNFGGLTAAQKSAYEKHFAETIENVIVPAYRNIIDTLTGIRKSNASKLGLCNYENGKSYYEYLVRSNTGSSKSVNEIYELIDDEISAYMWQLSGLMILDSDLYEKMTNFTYPVADDDPEGMLDLLIKALQEDFPEAVNSDYTVNYVPESLQGMMNPAFYLVAPIDNMNRNIIYINRSEDYDSMDIFPTIAHEGFPGHMYQTNYWYSTNPHYFRTIFSFGGYTEGWAHYVENEYSYKYAGADTTLASAFEINSECGFALYCMVDIGVNYLGWTYEDTEEYLAGYISSSKDVAEEIYYTMIDEPGVYMQYYLGCLEIEQLKAAAEEKLGSGFDIVEFHKFILEMGPCYFDIIEERMYAWMSRVCAG